MPRTKFARSRSFALFAKSCATKRLSHLIKLFRCTDNHTKNDAKLYDAPDPNRIRQLISRGANVNVRHCFTGETPLHCAVYEAKDINIIKEYLKHGADANMAEMKGLTPLHTAIQNMNLEYIPVLIHHGADINLKSKPPLPGEVCAYDISPRRFTTAYSPLDIAMDNVQAAKLVIMHALLAMRSGTMLKDVIDLKKYKDRAGYKELRSYLIDCYDQVRKMKACKLSSRVSLFDWVYSLIYGGELSFDYDLDSLTVSKILQAENEHNFSFFRGVIITGIGRRNLVNKLSEQYDNVPLSALGAPSRKIYLDIYAVYPIIDFLSEEDIFNILIAFYVPDNIGKSQSLQKELFIGVKRPFSDIDDEHNDAEPNDAELDSDEHDNAKDDNDELDDYNDEHNNDGYDGDESDNEEEELVPLYEKNQMAIFLCQIFQESRDRRRFECAKNPNASVGVPPLSDEAYNKRMRLN